MPGYCGGRARKARHRALSDIDRGPSAWSVIAMLRIAIFVSLLLLALAYALRKGGGPERAVAAILILMALADQALHLFVPVEFLAVDTRSEEHSSELQSLIHISYAVYVF